MPHLGQRALACSARKIARYCMLLVAMTTLQGCWMFREAGSWFTRDPSSRSVSSQTRSATPDLSAIQPIENEVGRINTSR
jgi:hypothetical protein